MGLCLGTIVSTARGFNHASSTRHNFPPVEQDSVLMRGAVGSPHQQSCHYCASGHILSGMSVLQQEGSSAGSEGHWCLSPPVACIAPVALSKSASSKWIRDLNLRPDTLKLLEEKVGSLLQVMDTWTGSPNRTPVAQEMIQQLAKGIS